jgi:beta-glucosidase
MKQELLLSRGFSPDLDLPRNPSWSRMWESFGEDVFSNGATVEDVEGKRCRFKI